MYTRQQHMAEYSGLTKEQAKDAHRRYFGQLVTNGTIARVLSGIGKDALLKSTDEHLNDIPLHLWDRLVPKCPGSAGFAKIGDYYTLANGVCLLKEAARQIIEKEKTKC